MNQSLSIFTRNGRISVSLLILSLALIPTVALSQDNFISGYVVTNNKDTITGYVDYRNWSVNPEKIAFKAHLTDDRILFSPLDIICFSVAGELYESGIIIGKKNAGENNKESESGILRLQRDTIFLQTLITGEKSLYKYRNRGGTNVFYIKRNGDFELLGYNQYNVQQNGKTYLAKDKQYVAQLISYFQDCPSIVAAIQSTNYSAKYLEKLFLTYYACKNEPIAFKNQTEENKPKWGALSGISVTSLNFEGYGNSPLINTKFDQSTNIAAGVFLEIFIPRNFQKWSIYNELAMSTYKVKGNYNDFTSGENYSTYHTTIGHTHLKTVNMIRFSQAVRRTSLFINAGMTNGFVINETNSMTIVSKFYNSENTREQKALEDTRKYEQGLAIGFGSIYKAMSLQWRLERGSGISAYTNLKSTTNRHYLLLGYSF
ncbi:outer membrane beta-barrel protein [Olivibacter sp. SDN3]|uniref:outer membrane beta-barrel protein n=1 Tax=Olivibacter sp. SDN3 TaxID=2764720 RepID=UPI0016517475|nr:outer membrane beta-barrel protein [Olivibacter sp. SDN3]QNL49034.1 outer membrane beta-barrel protein [Olivibacter sp. SDN3]